MICHLSDGKTCQVFQLKKGLSKGCPHLSGDWLSKVELERWQERGLLGNDLNQIRVLIFDSNFFLNLHNQLFKILIQDTIQKEKWMLYLDWVLFWARKVFGPIFDKSLPHLGIQGGLRQLLLKFLSGEIQNPLTSQLRIEWKETWFWHPGLEIYHLQAGYNILEASLKGNVLQTLCLRQRRAWHYLWKTVIPLAGIL